MFRLSCAAARRRGRARGQKRRAAVFNCRAVIFNVITRDIHLMGMKPLDSGLLSGKWRLDCDIRRSDIRRVWRLISFLFVSGVICEKIQALRHDYVPLKHYTFPRTLKIEGTLMTANVNPKPFNIVTV